jgi:hypothetical protein
MARYDRIASTVVIVDGMPSVTWNAAGRNIVFRVVDCSDDIQSRLLAYGAKKKVADSAAGTNLSVSERMLRMENTVNNLTAGVWSSRVSDSLGLLAEAIAEVRGVSPEAALVALGGLSDVERKRLEGSTAIAPVYARLKAERFGDDDDETSDALLAALGL